MTKNPGCGAGVFSLMVRDFRSLESTRNVDPRDDNGETFSFEENQFL
jgi:hypothetical protein